jgi:Ca2+-transporting ATPase
MSSTPYKRRSPPPPRSPGPSSSALPNGHGPAIVRRGSFPRPSQPGYAYSPEIVDLAVMDGPEPSSSAAHAQSSTGQYAYSTTLRRQQSVDPSGYPIPRSASPHAGSPYRKRTASSSYPNGNGSAQGLAAPHGMGSGLLDRVLDMGRKAIGRRGYEELANEEEGRRASAERKAQETPSAVYAHKSVEVSSSRPYRPDRRPSNRPNRTVQSVQTSPPSSRVPLTRVRIQ